MKTLADYGLTVTATMTTPSRAGKKPRPVWNVTGNVYGLDDTFRDLGGRRFRGAWSFFSDPTEAILRDVERYGRASFAAQVKTKQERAADRAERYDEWADKASKRSDAALGAVKRIADGIPFGQPILVGHHSERHARRDQERIRNGMRRGVDEAKKADYLTGRAEAAARNAEDVTDLGFMGRRLAEAEAEIRDMERRLARYGSYSNGEAALAAAREEAAYWKEKMAAAGGVRWSKENIKPGDFMTRTKGDAFFVRRANAKTVTVVPLTRGCEAFQWTVPYAEVKAVATPKEGSDMATMAREVYGFKGTYPA